MNRRGFLRSILALGAAPAICKAANLMPVVARKESGLLVPSYDGAVIELFDAAGNKLATIPLYAQPASQGRIWLSGSGDVVQSGIYRVARLEVPSLFQGDPGLVMDTSTLATGQMVTANISL